MPVWEFWVRDSRTNEPIPSAGISLYAKSDFTLEREGGVTDAAGHALIDTGTAAATAYIIRKEGYVRIRSTDLNPTNDVRMDSTEAKYTVTFSADPHGTIEPYGKMTVASDTRIKTTATPNVGYVFRAFVVDGKDYTGVNPFSFPISRDGMVIVAEFETEAEAVAKKPRKPGEVVTEVAVTTVVSGGIPWPFSWIEGVVNWFGQAWESINKSLIDALRSEREEYQKATQIIEEYRIEHGDMQQRELTKSAGKGGWLWGGLSESMGELVKNSMNEALTEVVRLAPEATGHSPEAKKQMAAVLEPYANSIVDAVLAEVSPAKYAKSPITPEEAKNSLNLIMGGIVSVEIGLFVAHAFLEGATLGQVEALSQIENMVISKLGLNQVASAAITIPLNELVLKRAQQYYAAEYTPEIPSYQDLIEMVVKEVIPLGEFKRQMKYLGYSEYWSQYIWDKHFIPPSLADILTAWRRGLIDEKRVDELMILVDLDPRFKEIFDTRKYITPPLSLTRFMFETGAISAETVRKNVALEGFAPEYVEAVTSYIVNFQARRWRTRYLQALSTGMTKGVVTEDEVLSATLEAGYTADVAKWIVETSKVRARVTGAAVVEEKPKLIGVGDLKKAYVKNMIDADKLRIDLQVRGYQVSDVDLLVKLLDEEKVVTSAGGGKVALSVPELKAAWKYKEVTEDRVRIELQLRGLSLDETDILLNTWKKQLGVEGAEVP